MLLLHEGAVCRIARQSVQSISVSSKITCDNQSTGRDFLKADEDICQSMIQSTVECRYNEVQYCKILQT